MKLNNLGKIVKKLEQVNKYKNNIYDEYITILNYIYYIIKMVKREYNL